MAGIEAGQYIKTKLFAKQRKFGWARVRRVHTNQLKIDLFTTDRPRLMNVRKDWCVPMGECPFRVGDMVVPDQRIDSISSTQIATLGRSSANLSDLDLQLEPTNPAHQEAIEAVKELLQTEAKRQQIKAIKKRILDGNEVHDDEGGAKRSRPAQDADWLTSQMSADQCHKLSERVNSFRALPIQTREVFYTRTKDVYAELRGTLGKVAQSHFVGFLHDLMIDLHQQQVKEEQKKKEATVCPNLCKICWAVDSDRVLECGHVFCSACVQKVSVCPTSVCPTCRAAITQPAKRIFL